jgi:hypothetical protein
VKFIKKLDKGNNEKESDSEEESEEKLNQQ